MTSRGVWLGDSDGPGHWQPSAAWLTGPRQNSSGLGVLVLPPIGYESSSSHRFWRTLAERLADRGATVLRLDYWATGDSAGHAAQLDSLEPWRGSVATAATFLRQAGAAELVVVGCQLGASLAFLDAEVIDAVGVVAVAPVFSGRRFVRGLSVLGVRAPDDLGKPTAGGVSVGGHFLTPSLLAAISDLAVTPLDSLPLLQIDAPRVASVLQRPAEEAEVPDDVIADIVDWIADLPPIAPKATRTERPVGRIAAATSTVLDEQGVRISEEFVSLGHHELIGVLTVPEVQRDRAESVYVLVNSGSDPHVGPGRAWVELARHLATVGISTVRCDLRGWGESPDGPSVPGRPYDEHGIDDIVSVVRALRERGHSKVVLGGLCAGAWIALAAALRSEVAGSVVLNPQLYWRPGDPVEALMTTTRTRRQEEIATIKADARAGRWDEADAAGDRPPAGALLDDLAQSGGITSMLFADCDDGIEYLRDRLGRRLDAVTASGRVRVVELPDVDHGMHRVWMRPTVFETIAAEIRAVVGDRRR